MALTVNRNNEISLEEFEELNRKFRTKTHTKAIYACVNYVLKNQKADHLSEIENLKTELKELREKHLKLIKIVKKKYVIDNEFEQLLFEE